MNPSCEFAGVLLEKARGDRQACFALMLDPAMPAWLVGFHAQQAVEKALKSALAAVLVEYPRTHNLSTLLALARQGGLPLPLDAEELVVLTPFGTAFRYDDDSAAAGSVTLDHAWVQQHVDGIIGWAETVCDQQGAE